MSTEPDPGPVERSIREAMARGEFDDLPGRGKPIADLDREYDPDWWARRHLERARAEDAADEVRRLIRAEVPRLRTMRDRVAADRRLAEIGALVAEVNRRLPAGERIDLSCLSPA